MGNWAGGGGNGSDALEAQMGVCYDCGAEDGIHDWVEGAGGEGGDG